MDAQDKEFKIPLILIGIGLVIIVIAAFLGTESVLIELIALLVGVAILVVLGIIALYITAAIMKIDFGPLSSASVKLVALFVFPDAIAALIPSWFLGWFVSVVIYLWLLAWLFELEWIETVVCIAAIILVRIAAVFLAVMFIASVA